MRPLPATDKPVALCFPCQANRDSAAMTKPVPLKATLRTIFDFHVLMTLALRGWTLLAGLLTVIAVPHWLSATEQGYYFAFGSLIALQLFFELGFSYVVTQYAARQLPLLTWTDGWIGGAPVGVARVARLLHIASRAYAIIGMAFFVLVGLAGTWFFSSAQATALPWLLSWWMMVAMTAGNLMVSPWLAVAEGLGRVGNVARVRTMQSIVGYGLAWSLMATGMGLFALPAIAGAALFGSLVWLYRDSRDLRRLRCRGHDAAARNALSWRRDLLPFQWRIAMSWASGYIIFQLFTPITFRLYGPVAAGQIGLILAITSSLSMLAMSWVNAKAPEITRLLASSDVAAAKRLFLRQACASSATHIIAMLGLLGGTVIARALGLAWSERLPPMDVLLAVVAASVCSQLIFSMAVFIRAHGHEALMWPSIWTGIMTLAMVTVLAPQGVAAAMFGYAAVQAFLCLPWVAWIFFRKFWSGNGLQGMQHAG
jgi:hypothetical protein